MVVKYKIFLFKIFSLLTYKYFLNFGSEEIYLSMKYEIAIYTKFKKKNN